MEVRYLPDTQPDYVCIALKTYERLENERETLTRNLTHVRLTLTALGHDIRHSLHVVRAASRTERSLKESERVNTPRYDVDSLIDSMVKKCEQAALLSARRGRPDRYPLHIEPILAAVFNQWRPEADRRGTSLCLRVLPTMAVSNAFWLEVIASNVVGNAVKNTRGGEVVVESAFDGADLILSISDNGRGFGCGTDTGPLECGSPEDTSAGLGLGMLIIRQAADLLLHPLSVESSVTGTVVKLVLSTTGCGSDPRGALR